MAWLEKKQDWLSQPTRGKGNGKRRLEKMYSVSEVAELLSVSRGTVFKWLSLDEPEEAVIPPDAWIKLPNGYIRIREVAVLKLQGKGHDFD